MTQHPHEHQNILKIASMRFRTVIAQAEDRQSITLTLPADPDVEGFIVLLQPVLPSIS
jgi:hypothetical protein